MSVMVIACYRPKPGRASAILDLVRGHAPALRREGLIDDAPTLAGRAGDGTIVEIFCWKSEEASRAAHENPVVSALWAAFAEACDFVSVGDLAEAKEMFAHFEKLDFA